MDLPLHPSGGADSENEKTYKRDSMDARTPDALRIP